MDMSEFDFENSVATSLRPATQGACRQSGVLDAGADEKETCPGVEIRIRKTRVRIRGGHSPAVQRGARQHGSLSRVSWCGAQVGARAPHRGAGESDRCHT